MPISTWRPGRDRAAVRHPGTPARPGAGPGARGRTVVVVGGGIAGLSAAVELAERGVQVTLVERHHELGGRVRSWPVRLHPGPDLAPTGPDLAQTVMSRGFHAFFRQYYQLRALLRRADPTLSHLRPVEDYPLVLADGPRDSFRHVPRTPPLNLVGFVATSPSFTLRDLTRLDVDAALGLLDVDFPATFSELDGRSAADVLDELRFPDTARHLALEVFARSFFADPRELSGGELIAMFHTYFVGSAEGLLFDVADDDFGTALWRPLAAYLERLGAKLLTGTTVTGVVQTTDGWRVATDAGELTADAVVLATDLRPLQGLVGDGELGPEPWREAVARLRSAPPFLVWRLWLDRAPRPGTPEFLGTSGYGRLDNVSMIHLFERSAADWAAATGGSVVELHAYALPPGVDEASLRRDLTDQLHRLHPELADAGVLGEQWLVQDDCSVVGTAPWRERPGVVTPLPGLVLAGDGIRTDYPVALMERAATTGVLAANHLLAGWGAPTADIWTAPMSARLPGVRALRAAVRRGAAGRRRKLPMNSQTGA